MIIIPFIKEKKAGLSLSLGQHYYQEDDGSYVHVFAIPEKSVHADISNMPIPSKKRWKPDDFPILAQSRCIFQQSLFLGMTTAREACGIILNAAVRPELF